MTKRNVLLALGILFVVAFVALTVWYVKTNVKLVTKDERRELVVTEVSKALERYYDEHGRYPVVETNTDLLRELSAKKYFDTEVRLDVVQYVPINYGQRYELR